MKDFKGTTGEYYIHGDYIKSKWEHSDGGKDGAFLCKMLYEKHKEANAKLFAASKDMAEALQAMIEAWEAVELNPVSPTYLNAKAALSKALD